MSTPAPIDVARELEGRMRQAYRAAQELEGQMRRIARSLPLPPALPDKAPELDKIFSELGRQPEMGSGWHAYITARRLVAALMVHGAPAPVEVSQISWEDSRVEIGWSSLTWLVYPASLAWPCVRVRAYAGSGARTFWLAESLVAFSRERLLVKPLDAEGHV